MEQVSGAYDSTHQKWEKNSRWLFMTRREKSTSLACLYLELATKKVDSNENYSGVPPEKARRNVAEEKHSFKVTNYLVFCRIIPA